MTVIALKSRALPNYTKSEEIVNSASHAVGVVFGIFVLITCLINSSNITGRTGSIVYGLSMILLYATSSIYHGINPKNLLAKQVFRIMDHCTIHVLIAGTYTPVILNVIYPSNPTEAILILIGIWAAAILGIVLTAVDLQKYAKLSMACYIVMGWFAIFLMKPLFYAIGINGILLLVGGGISYTVGAVLYVIGKKKRYIHSVFHVFVLLGTLLHYICIINYVIS